MTFPSSPQQSSTGSSIGRNFKIAAIVIGIFIAGIWVLEAIDYVLPLDMDQWGIHGLSISGLLPGMLLAPLLHVGFGHVISNTLPLLVLGFLSAAKGLRPFIFATAIIVVVSGIGVWLTSPGTVTVGASGVVFGYFGYVIGRGIFDRSLIDILVAVVVIVIYGSLIWGVFPSDPSTSWQAHLFGLIGGVISAWALRRKSAKTSLS